MNIHKKNYGKTSGKFWKILIRSEIFKKILTNFIFFIGKLQRNPEMIFVSILWRKFIWTEKENLLSPLRVIKIVARSETLTVEDVRSYLLSILRKEAKQAEEEKDLIEKYKQETERIRQHLQEIQNGYVYWASYRWFARSLRDANLMKQRKQHEITHTYVLHLSCF